MGVLFQTMPELRSYEDAWIVAYQEALKDPRDQGDSASGRMHALRLCLYDVLGLNTLSRYHTYLNRLEDARQLEAAGA